MKLCITIPSKERVTKMLLYFKKCLNTHLLVLAIFFCVFLCTVSFFLYREYYKRFIFDESIPSFDLLCQYQHEASVLITDNASSVSPFTNSSVNRFKRWKGSESNYTTDDSTSTVRKVNVRFLTTVTLGNINDKIMYTNNVGTNALFYFLASSTLAGISLDVIIANDTYQMENKLRYFDAYSKEESLEDDDVIIFLDSIDIMFNGKDILPVIEHYVANSPSSLDKLDARRVRLHQQMAPVIFSSETVCGGFEAVIEDSTCVDKYNKIEALVSKIIKNNNNKDKRNLNDKNAQSYTNENQERNRNAFANAGFVVGRVWALKMFQERYEAYLIGHLPTSDIFWSYDQGIVHEMLWDLRYCELIRQDLFYNGTSYTINHLNNNVVNIDKQNEEASLSFSTSISKQQKNCLSGLPFGLISLDYKNLFTGLYSISPFQNPVATDISFMYANGRKIKPKWWSNGEERKKLLNWARKEIKNKRILTTRTAAGAPMAAAFIKQVPTNRKRIVTSAEEEEQKQKGFFPVITGNEEPPAIWHFPGDGKKMYGAFADLLPTRIILDDANFELKEETRRVFWSTASTWPHRVWSSSVDDKDSFTIYFQRNSSFDFTPQRICSFLEKEKKK